MVDAFDSRIERQPLALRMLREEAQKAKVQAARMERLVKRCRGNGCDLPDQPQRRSA